jgi:hypothetical protein
MRVKFDPKILRLTSVRQGALLTSDGKSVNFTENTMNDTGDALISLSRAPGTGGVNGSGALVTFTFQTIGRGVAAVTFPELALKNSKMEPITAAAPSLTIEVQ